MKLAINYSPQAAELVASGDIEVDLYKCPDWESLVEPAQKQRPAYVHFALMAGRGNQLTFDHIEDWLKRTGTRYVNTHLAPRGADYGIPSGSKEIRHTDEMVERMITDVQALVDHFGADRVIVENAPMPDRPKYDIPVVPVEAIGQVVEATGCGFLLDIAHATLTCLNLECDIYEYMDSLPVHRLCELHVTGIGTYTDGAPGDHLPMTDKDWALFEWALGRIREGDWSRPDIVAFEYGGTGPMFEWRSEKSVIAEQMPRLYRLVYKNKPQKPNSQTNAG